MPWTTLELQILQTTSRVSSVFSLLGAGFIIVTFCTSKSFHKPINRLAFFAAFGNILTNAATITSQRGIEAGRSSALCRIQATFIQWFMPADALFCLAMALNVYLTVFKKYTTKRLKDLEVIYICFCYGVPAIPAIAFLFIKNEEGVPVYGSATLWCWISSDWQFLRIAGFYGPVWIIIGITIIIYILAGRVIFSLRGSLRGFAGKDPSVAPESEAAASCIMSPMASASYSVTVESPKVGRSRNPAVEGNTAAWAYCRCAMLFFLALLITWLPSSVNRIYTLAYPNATNFGLNFAAALVLPCQGFWNGLIYIVTTLPACKGFCHRAWAQMRRPWEKIRRWRCRRRYVASKDASMASLNPV